MADQLAYIGLGSNLNEPVGQVLRAMSEIDALSGLRITAKSSLYRSGPMGPQDQPDYVNAVIAVLTKKSPTQLLRDLQQIEQQHQRKRELRWGARTLDLDILLYGARIIANEVLQIPHPGLPARAFVLYPLHQVAGDIQIPKYGALADLIEACDADDLRELDLGESGKNADR